MSGKGTGYPIWFVCPVARRTRYWPEPYPVGHERIVRTGRTRPMRHNGKGHPRKLWISHEFRCECGYVGWSSSHNIVDYPLDRS